MANVLVVIDVEVWPGTMTPGQRYPDAYTANLGQAQYQPYTRDSDVAAVFACYCADSGASIFLADIGGSLETYATGYP